MLCVMIARGERKGGETGGEKLAEKITNQQSVRQAGSVANLGAELGNGQRMAVCNTRKYIYFCGHQITDKR